MSPVDVAPVAWLGTTAFVWLLTFVQNGRLLRYFRNAYPSEAEHDIPWRGMRHPELSFYFYRQKVAKLAQDNPKLARMRQHFILLSVLSILWPFVSFLFLALSVWRITK